MKYYSSTNERNSVSNNIAAPYIRKTFDVESFLDEYKLTISVVGIYELFVNGKRINKGFITPYRSNPNHIVYKETYALNKYLKKGKNVIGIMLGNGFSNSVYNIWDFDKASWSSSPKIALEVFKNNQLLFDMSTFKTFSSEVVFDDFHSGEHIDMNKIIKDWLNDDYDDSFWQDMILVDSPKGDLKEHPLFYVNEYEVVTPKLHYKDGKHIIFDIGESCSFMYRISVKGEKNKRITLFANDAINEDNTIFLESICCLGKDLPLLYQQFDWFILSGNEDVFTNRFSFKAGRFIQLDNINEEEMSTLNITIYKISSCVKQNGFFACDNEIINKLQDCVIKSDVSNFVLFPTDCPHREKNGWTGDVMLSSEQFLLNLDCYDQLIEWLRHVVKAQREDGALPGIVPTDTWGFEWGNGPGWDGVLFELPYRLYVYSGNIEPLSIVHEAIIKYLSYMRLKENELGLFDYGLEDWVPVKTHTPTVVSDTILCKYMCDIAGKIFYILNDKENEKIAINFSNKIKANYQKNFSLEYQNQKCTQTQAAMNLYFDMFDECEREKCVDLLLKTIKDADDAINFGAMGNRFFFRALAENGFVDKAINLMIQDKKVSFKKLIDQKATTLFEKFLDFDSTIYSLPLNMEEGERSMNHHFWGDISAFYYRYLAGIKIDCPNVLTFSPSLSEVVKNIKCKFKDIEVEINYVDNSYKVKLFIPDSFDFILKLPKGYTCNIDKLVHGNNNLVIKKEEKYE